MKNSASESKTNIGGVSTKTVMIPMIFVLAVLLILVVVTIVLSNYYSNKLSTTMQNYSDYIFDASSLQAGSSLLSETSSTFVLMPETEAGYLNITPLIAYANELEVERRGDQVVERFRGYDVSKEAFEYILAAAECANNMMEAQVHAIALMDSIYTLPDMPEELKKIPKAELTGRELDYTKSQKAASAEVLVLGTEYSENKQGVSENVSTCVAVLQKESAQKSDQIGKILGCLRTAIWAFTLLIIIVFSITFIVLYRKLVSPLEKFVHMIAAGSPLDDKKGLYEVRLLARSYNALLTRRDILEAGLRSAAETDALTNLPNRYRFKQYLLESVESGHSVAFFVFDVNYLKITNDTQGHLAGDKLLCNAADCISECFGSVDDSMCFRYGGDEFAAILKDCSTEHIERMIEKFEREQKKRNISVAIGYAYTENIGETTLNDLFLEADKNMYAKKEKMHGNESKTENETETETGNEDKHESKYKSKSKSKNKE